VAEERGVGGGIRECLQWSGAGGAGEHDLEGGVLPN
jgi:hypothetical protein